jgi:hypothetical protein
MRRDIYQICERFTAGDGVRSLGAALSTQGWDQIIFKISPTVRACSQTRSQPRLGPVRMRLSTAGAQGQSRRIKVNQGESRLHKPIQGAKFFPDFASENAPKVMFFKPVMPDRG